jgi:hypothetical protein
MVRTSGVNKSNINRKSANITNLNSNKRKNRKFRGCERSAKITDYFKVGKLIIKNQGVEEQFSKMSMEQFVNEADALLKEIEEKEHDLAEIKSIQSIQSIQSIYSIQEGLPVSPALDPVTERDVREIICKIFFENNNLEKDDPEICEFKINVYEEMLSVMKLYFENKSFTENITRMKEDGVLNRFFKEISNSFEKNELFLMKIEFVSLFLYPEENFTDFRNNAVDVASKFMMRMMKFEPFLCSKFTEEKMKNVFQKNFFMIHYKLICKFDQFGEDTLTGYKFNDVFCFYVFAFLFMLLASSLKN